MRWQQLCTGLSLVTLLVFVGCTADDPVLSAATLPGQDGGQTAGAGSTDGGALAADAAPPAFCPLECLPPAPPGWIGPNAIFEGSEASKPTACPAPYTQLVAEAHQGVSGAPAECACGPVRLEGAACDADVELHATSACNSATPIFAGTVSSGGPCLFINNNSPAYLIVAAPRITRGECTFSNGTKTVPARTFDSVKVACGLPQNAACEGRADCVASPVPGAPFTRLCIQQDGDNPCPSADYANRVLAFKTVSDTRDCSACTGVPAGGTCGTTYGFAATGSPCDATVATPDQVLTCRSNPGAGQYVNGTALAPTGITCTTSGGARTGDVASADPVTFCCNR